jgi:hypothetical protein
LLPLPLTPSAFIDEISPIPGITGCYQSSGSVELFLPFVLLFALEFGKTPRSFIYTQSSVDQNLPGLLSLTLIRVIHSWRATNNCLFVVLLKHNIFYYACGLFESAHTHAVRFSMLIVLVSKVFSAANILMSLLLHVSIPPPPLRLSH